MRFLKYWSCLSFKLVEYTFKIVVLVFIINTNIGCKQKMNSNSCSTSEINKDKLQDLLNSKTKRDDSIENLKKIIFTDSVSFSQKKQMLDSILISLCDSNSLPLKSAMSETTIIHFKYDSTDSTINNLIKDSKNILPQRFLNCIKSDVPIYLRITADGEIKHAAGNKFADGGLRRADVGAAYDQGNYGAWTEPSTYSLDFLYLDTKYDTTDAKFMGSLFNLDYDKWLGHVDIGRTNHNPLYYFVNNEIIYDSVAIINSSDSCYTKSKQKGYNINNLAQHIFKHNYEVNYNNYSQKRSRFEYDGLINSVWINRYDPNDWETFFKEFKNTIINNDEAMLISLSSVKFSDGTNMAQWIKDFKGYKSLQEVTKGLTIDKKSNFTNAFVSCPEGSCKLSFKFINNQWMLHDIIPYYDPNHWLAFFKDFKNSMLNNNESNLISVSSRKFSDGTDMKQWIKSFKGYKSLLEVVKDLSIDEKSDSTNALVGCSVGSCQLSFRFINNHWMLNDIIPYGENAD